MSVWFTADTHFGHARVIAFCRGPFLSVGEMDAALIRNWNVRVQPSDAVYHLGDFSFGDKAAVRRYRERLNGRINLVRGNHEKKSRDFNGIFESVADLSEITITVAGAGQRVALCHYAMRVWPHSHHRRWHLYGHSHGTLRDDPHALSLDVGEDCWDYAPVSAAQILRKMAAKEWRPVDHHGRGETEESAS